MPHFGRNRSPSHRSMLFRLALARVFPPAVQVNRARPLSPTVNVMSIVAHLFQMSVSDTLPNSPPEANGRQVRYSEFPLRRNPMVASGALPFPGRFNWKMWVKVVVPRRVFGMNRSYEIRHVSPFPI